MSYTAGDVSLVAFAAPWMLTGSFFTYLIKGGHRLISTSDLDLKERSFHARTAFFGALHVSFGSVRPVGRTNFVLLRLALK